MLKHLVSVISTVLLLSGCVANQTQTIVATHEQIKLSEEAVKLIKQQIPADTLFSLKPQSNDGNRSALEISLQSKLRQSGYAVQDVLPLQHRQNGDVKEMKSEGTPLMIDFIPYTGTEYGELTLSIGNDRYSRLYLHKNRSTAPLSEWIRRVGGE